MFQLSMCATFQFKKQVIKPEKNVVAAAESGLVQHVWAEFARAQVMDWWRSKEGVLLDIYADRFAERSDSNGKDLVVVIGTSGVVLPIADMALQLRGFKTVNNLAPEQAINANVFDRVFY